MSEQQDDTQQELQQLSATLSEGTVKRSPQNGECVGHCAHVSTGQPVWYLCDNTTYADPVKNVSGKIDWLCICTECESALKADPKAKVLAGLGLLEKEPQLRLLPIPELQA